ncbi:hypothetical protein LguiA_015812 [Lonicera macranthoides]
MAFQKWSFSVFNYDDTHNDGQYRYSPENYTVTGILPRDSSIQFSLYRTTEKVIAVIDVTRSKEKGYETTLEVGFCDECYALLIYIFMLRSSLLNLVVSHYPGSVPFLLASCFETSLGPSTVSFELSFGLCLHPEPLLKLVASFCRPPGSSSSYRGNRGRGGPQRSPARNIGSSGIKSQASSSQVKPPSPGNFKEALKEEVQVASKKPQQDFVLYLQKGDQRFAMNPGTIAQRYFENNMDFPLISGKTRKYYEAILKDTDSVVFTHMNRNVGSLNPEIAFSKAFIKGVINIEEWGLNPNKEQALQTRYSDDRNAPRYYNYWDYIDAWKKAFLYQNQYNSHTWFFRIDKLKGDDSYLESLPHWFFQWFILNGPEEDIFPNNLYELFNLFEFLEINTKSAEDDAFLKKQVIEKSEFKTLSLASLKEKFPNTPIKELKAKILQNLACQLDMDEDFMSISQDSKSEVKSEPAQLVNIDDEDFAEPNEDMTTHMGRWLASLYEDSTAPPAKDKGKNQVE